MKHRCNLLITLGLPCLLLAQNPLHINSNLPPKDLIEKVLLDGVQGIKIIEATHEGHLRSQGLFTYDSQYYIIKKGIVLSTGFVDDVPGPNDVGGSGQPIGSKGDADLEMIAGRKTYDASRLSFTFIPEYDSLAFNYIFASEEYPEYVNHEVNDVFAFFIEDLKTEKKSNLAVLEKNGHSINVDNINARKNREFYIPNERWDYSNIMKWKDERARGELSFAFQFDGFTTLLSTGCKIVPGRKYRITFVIADVGDMIYDSAVFLEQGSFKVFSTTLSEELVQFEQNLKREMAEENLEIHAESGTVTMRLMVNFDFDKDIIRDQKSSEVIGKVSRLMRMNPNIKVRVKGNTDNMGSLEYNLDLSERRAKTVSEVIQESGVTNDRVYSQGFGDTRPIADNYTETGRFKNRRVEFEFYMD